MKVALLVAYDGVGFRGFARQAVVRTVQGELERVLSLIMRTSVETVGAGRTDAGVHAWGQVVSFAAADGTDLDAVRLRVNKMLGPEVMVRAAAEVPEGFSARFDATRRAYEYRCYRSDADDPFRDRFSTRIDDDVALQPMRLGARALVGEHDFSTFCRRGAGTLVRRIRKVAIAESGDEVTFTLEADSFCHQMVRSIVGLLLDVGRGKREPADVGAALAARDRSASGPVAPARGLHLVRVEYKPDPFV